MLWRKEGGKEGGGPENVKVYHNLIAMTNKETAIEIMQKGVMNSTVSNIPLRDMNLLGRGVGRGRVFPSVGGTGGGGGMVSTTVRGGGVFKSPRLTWM